MIKEALQYIAGLASQKTLEIHGQQYSNHSLTLLEASNSFAAVNPQPFRICGIPQISVRCSGKTYDSR